MFCHVLMTILLVVYPLEGLPGDSAVLNDDKRLPSEASQVSASLGYRYS